MWRLAVAGIALGAIAICYLLSEIDRRFDEHVNSALAVIADELNEPDDELATRRAGAR